ncbi:MAG: RNA polymerase sigma factor [Anaerolineae bacterium]
MEEQKAIARLKQGDIRGLEALVRKYQSQAVRAAFLVTRDRALAEDVVQTAFLRVYDSIAQFDSGRPFGPWFLRIVIHDAVKAAVREERCLSLQADTNEEDILLDCLVDPNPGPLETLVVAETREAIWVALGELPPAQRAAVVLRYYLGLSEGEMADLLVRPLGTIKWRLYAARQRLRALLQPLQGADRDSELLKVQGDGRIGLVRTPRR